MRAYKKALATFSFCFIIPASEKTSFACSNIEITA